MKIKLIATALAGWMTLGASSCDTTSTDGTAPPPTPPSPTKVSMGTKVDVGDGKHLQVMKYVDHFPDVSGHVITAKGEFFAAILAEGCAETNTDKKIDDSDFEMILPDNTRADSMGLSDEPTAQMPGFTTSIITAGTCVRGWAFFMTRAKPATVVSKADRVTWTIP